MLLNLRSSFINSNEREIIIASGKSVSFKVNDTVENFYGKEFWDAVENADYEAEQISDILKVIKKAEKNSYFIDIGSSCGLYSLLAGSFGLEVLSIEPDIQQFKALIINLELNPLFRIKPIRGFIIESDDLKLTPYALDQNKNNTDEIERIKLSNLLRDSETYVVKCDIEGGEWNILRSKLFQAKIKSCRKFDLFLSVHVGFHSSNYHKNYFQKTIFRIKYLYEVYTLFVFSKSASEIFYRGFRVSPLKLISEARIFQKRKKGGDYTSHVHFVFKNQIKEF